MAVATRDEALWLRANALARKHGRSETFERTSPLKQVKAFIAELDGAGKSAPTKRSATKPVKKASVVKKRSVKKAAPVKRGPGRPRKSETQATTTKRGPGRPRKSETVEAPKRRGRPPGSKNKTSATKRAPATTAKRRATAQKNSEEPGRNVVRSRLKWSAQGYNPREGSVASQVFEVVKSVKGDREEAFKILRKRIKSLFPGYSVEKATQLLKYRISRVIWDFAQATGQHEKSDNRATYGTAGTGEGVYERGVAGNRGRPVTNGRKRSTARKATRKATTTRRKRTTARKR